MHGRHSAVEIDSASCSLTELHANLGRRGSLLQKGETCGCWGVLLVLSGLVVATVGAQQAGERSSSGASGAAPAVSVSDTVYLPTARLALVPTARGSLGSQAAANLGLVRQLQYELTRIGCYKGDINGIWTPSTRRAMDALIEKVNAKLPTARPEPVHLALAQGQHPRSCDQCPIGEEIKSGRRCARPATDAVLAASIAPLLTPEPVVGGSGKRRPVPKPRHGGKGPTEGRMGLSVSGIPTQPSEPDAKRRVAVNHRASRHRGTARSLRLDRTGTYVQCGPCAMPTVVLRAFSPCCLDGDPLLTARLLARRAPLRASLAPSGVFAGPTTLPKAHCHVIIIYYRAKRTSTWTAVRLGRIPRARDFEGGWPDQRRKFCRSGVVAG